jgi:hypothetical protein
LPENYCAALLLVRNSIPPRKFVSLEFRFAKKNVWIWWVFLIFITHIVYLEAQERKSLNLRNLLVHYFLLLLLVLVNIYLKTNKLPPTPGPPFISTPKKYEVETKTWSTFSPLSRASASPIPHPLPTLPFGLTITLLAPRFSLALRPRSHPLPPRSIVICSASYPAILPHRRHLARPHCATTITTRSIGRSRPRVVSGRQAGAPSPVVVHAPSPERAL